MRTTVTLPDDLYRAAKKFAVETGRTLTAVIEDSVRQTLARRERSRMAAKPHFTTFGGHGLRPGVDLDRSAALLELMDTSRDAG